MKIEKGVPVKQKYRRGIWDSLCAKMGHGDSVVVETKTECASLLNAIKRAGFVGTSAVEDGKYRVWKHED